MDYIDWVITNGTVGIVLGLICAVGWGINQWWKNRSARRDYDEL